MIAIVNIDKSQSDYGEQEYEVRINEKIITRYKHKRENGLAKCLMEAAKAVEKAKWENAIRFLQ